MLDKIKKRFKRQLEIVEPYKYSDRPVETILIDDYGWHPMEIDTLYGRRMCLGIEIARMKREIWQVFYDWAK